MLVRRHLQDEALEQSEADRHLAEERGGVWDHGEVRVRTPERAEPTVEFDGLLLRLGAISVLALESVIAARRRLEAEVIRDGILQASGKLDPTLGGRSYRLVSTHRRQVVMTRIN